MTPETPTPKDFEPPIVTEIVPPRPKINFHYLELLQSLPDNPIVKND